jgi:hypothetical protein
MADSPVLELQLPHAVEERLKNHKVVTIPSQGRGRLTVRDVVGVHNNNTTSTGCSGGHRHLAAPHSTRTPTGTSNHSERVLLGGGGSSHHQQQQHHLPYQQQQQQQQRPRSLSAGRARSHRSNDLVQDLYDRMGVNLKKGQGIGGMVDHGNSHAVSLAALGSNTHSCTPLEMNHDMSSSTHCNWVARLRSNSSGGDDCRSTRSAGAASAPGGFSGRYEEQAPSNVVATLLNSPLGDQGMRFQGGPYRATAAAATATTYTSATTSTSTTSSAATATASRGRGREKSPNDHVAAGSGMGTAVVTAASSSSSGPDDGERRSRSLSRGRTSSGLAQRWPPPGLMNGISKAVEEAMAAKASTARTAVAAQQQQQQQPTNSASYSPKRINSHTGGVLLGSPTSTPIRQNKTGLTTARSMDNNYAGAPSSSAALSPSLSMGGEEKKDEERGGSRGGEQPIVVSIKDRISVYGNKVGDEKKKSKSKKNNKQKVKSNITRQNVDPEYIAQFSSRELPPKIDIYAEAATSKSHHQHAMEDEKKEADDMNDGHDHNHDRDHHDEEDDSPATVASAPVEGDKTTRKVTAVSLDQHQHHHVAAAAAAPTHQLQPSAGRKGGGLANAFLAAIQSPPSPAPASTKTPMPSAALTPSTSAAAAAAIIGGGAPVSEIAVTDNGDDMILGAGLSNDTNSMTGLSTMSGGEEFSLHSAVHKQPSSNPRGVDVMQQSQQPMIRRHSSWHLQQDQRNRVSAYKTTPNAAVQHPSSHQRSSSGAAAVVDNNNNSHHQQQSHGGGGLPSQQPQISMDAVQKMVEERVQAQVLELEARIETKLRRLVSQMEEKVMQRLDALENKITAVNNNNNSSVGSQEI